MIKIVVVLVYLFLSTSAFSQHKELDCVKGNYFHDYIVDLSGDTTFLEPIEFYFPVQDYLDINSDCFEAYQLSYYSKIMMSFNEQIYYNKKEKFIRIVVMDNKKITLYRIEQGDHETHNITIKNLSDNDSSSYEVENILINVKNYDNITEQILNSSIFSIKPHSVQYFAFYETNIILFESNIHGGYVFVDLHIPFTIKEKQFQGLYKAIEYLNSFSKKE